MSLPPITPPPPAQPAGPDGSTRVEELRDVARALEASFLAEMLKTAGLGSTRESFGGGAGEEAFSSMLANEQARLFAETGGIGLAEHIFNALVAAEGEAGNA
ncbi:MAG: rod-binding protein [Pseudomonadota bacterium]